MSGTLLVILLVAAGHTQALRHVGRHEAVESTVTPVKATVTDVAHGRHLLQGPCSADGSVAPADVFSMVTALLAPASGLTLLSASYDGVATASGVVTFPCEHALSPEFPNGAVVLTTGRASIALLMDSRAFQSMDNEAPGDADISADVGGATFDASVLTVKYRADVTGSLTFKYVFGSEEYPERVGQDLIDTFLLDVNGINVAVLPGTSIPVGINSVSSVTNTAFYVENRFNEHPSGYDGYTVKLTTRAVQVNAGETITLRLAIADGDDAEADSAVYLEAGSLTVDPSPGKTYECRDTEQYLVGTKQIFHFKSTVPGVLKPTHAERAEVCREACDAREDCDGYVYKTDRTCILKSGVTGFTTQTFNNIFIACRVVE